VLLDRGRERLVRQRMMLVNALRAHVAEFGVIAPQGLRVGNTRGRKDATSFPVVQMLR
jgi:transposase